MRLLPLLLLSCLPLTLLWCGSPEPPQSRYADYAGEARLTYRRREADSAMAARLTEETQARIRDLERFVLDPERFRPEDSSNIARIESLCAEAEEIGQKVADTPDYAERYRMARNGQGLVREAERLFGSLQPAAPKGKPLFGFVAWSGYGWGGSAEYREYATAMAICQVRLDDFALLSRTSETIPSPYVDEEVVFLSGNQVSGRGKVFEARPRGYDPEHITRMTVTEGAHAEFCMSAALFDQRTYSRELPDTTGVGWSVMQLLRGRLLGRKVNLDAVSEFEYESLEPAVWGPDGTIWFAMVKAAVLAKPDYDPRVADQPHAYRVLAAVTLEPDPDCFLLATTCVVGMWPVSWTFGHRDDAVRFFADRGLPFILPEGFRHPKAVNGFLGLDWLDVDRDECAEAIVGVSVGEEGAGHALLRFEESRWKVKADYACGP